MIYKSLFLSDEDVVTIDGQKFFSMDYLSNRIIAQYDRNYRTYKLCVRAICLSATAICVAVAAAIFVLLTCN